MNDSSKVQAALDEAEQLMSQLGSPSGGGGGGSNNDDDITFSIDSDDEDDDNNSNNQNNKKNNDGGSVARGLPKPTNSHPLLDDDDENYVQPLLPEQSQEQQHPLTQQQQQHPNSINNINSMYTAANSTQPTGYDSNAMTDHPLAGGSSSGGVTPLIASTGTTTTTPPSSLSGDSWKQQTSRFASAMANIAQRAAHQVVTATSTQPPPNNMVMMNNHQANMGPYHYQQQQYQQQQQPQASLESPRSGSSIGSSYGGHVVATTTGYVGSGGGDVKGTSTGSATTTTTATTAPPPGAAQTAAMIHSELDNEQKATLIQEHMGDLLPGERVIMFVANLLHVSDSTGFSYTYTPTTTNNNTNEDAKSSSQNSAIWCCVMTYYRLVLFGTYPSFPPPCPAGWNPACWPHRPTLLLQMPLAAMERVDRSVFTASTNTTTTLPPNLAGAVAAAAGSVVGGGAWTASTADAAVVVPTNTVSTTSLIGLHMVGKDNGRTIRFATSSYADTVRAHEALQTYAFPGRRNLGYLFAFESKKDNVMKSIVTDPTTGQKQVTLPPAAQRFDPMVEFTRQFERYASGNNNHMPCPWTVYTSVNVHYQLCGSYPSILAGPSSINENNSESLRTLQQSAAFRSEQRLPVLTYTSGRGGGSLWRCSQPKIGLQGNRSPADEWLLKQILDQAAQANAMELSQQQHQLRRSPPPPPLSHQMLIQLTGSASTDQLTNQWLPSPSSSSSSTAPCELKILDLRPCSSAMANRTGGYGYENTSNYPGCTLQFCGIGNIHAVRDAYQKISSTCLSTSTSDISWNSQVEDSKWLSHIRNILAASWETAYWIHVFSFPVLLHCSHGWDRTSQVACLAQLMLDPYYRTIPGFACLVEKDFMAFGHPFHTRCAHGVGTGGAGNNPVVSNTVGSNVAGVVGSVGGNHNKNDIFDEGQVSPIFMQFLDCVYQLVALYPDAFEITTRYLLDLSDHVYSCRFGNFLCDTERERENVAGIRQRTHSIWDFLQARHGCKSQAQPQETSTSGNSSRSHTTSIRGGVLLMPLPTLLRNVTLWTDRHAKYGPKATQRWVPPPPVVPELSQASSPPPPSSSYSMVVSSTTLASIPVNGRHDDDTPQFHRIPTFQEAQTQILQVAEPRSSFSSSSVTTTPSSDRPQSGRSDDNGCSSNNSNDKNKNNDNKIVEDENL